jgi:hypothetical protein
MSNQIIRGTPTADNPDGIQFVPKQVALDLGKQFASGPGSAGETVSGPVVAFLTRNGANPLPTTFVTGQSGVGSYYYQPMTNAQKLALPVDTALNTRVYVTDWQAALLTGPKQVLAVADPSDEAHWTNED